MDINSKAKTLIVIAGPTAVGKTAIAISLAKLLGTEIISADSRQCYRGMSIGTAQPTQEERLAVLHHFIDCYPPEMSLSAADFERIALQHLESIFAEHHTAVVCGGTGLYIKALCDGLDEMPSVDEKIALDINQNYLLKGAEWLRNQISVEDPLFAVNGEMNNPARILRALTFIRSTGTSITTFRTGIKKERPFRVIKIALELPRELLYQRINQRVDLMMQQGLLREVEQLFPNRNLKNLNTVGYSELFDFLENKCTLLNAIDKIKQHSRNYAKRQLTWLRKDKDFIWLDASDSQIIFHIQEIVSGSYR